MQDHTIRNIIFGNDIFRLCSILQHKPKNRCIENKLDLNAVNGQFTVPAWRSHFLIAQLIVRRSNF